MTMWKVTAGRANAFVREFLDRGMVAIGFSQVGDYTVARTRSDLIRMYGDALPNERPRQVQTKANQAWRFLREVRVGDQVITYDPEERLYHLGLIASDPSYEPTVIDQLPVTRRVDWQSKVSRDDLSQSTRYSLGATMTIFLVPAPASAEIVALAQGGPAPARSEPAPTSSPEVEPADPFAGIAEQALERIKDRILQLDWEEVQEIVAALLRALGYRTIISPSGSDRGKDIIASRDGFGFEPPRIVVEVKHHKEQIGAPLIRAFLGGRHSEDRGLYVSTGGFSREALYEAERATTFTHLMTLDGLARALVEQYELLDERGKALLPLTKIYIPA